MKRALLATLLAAGLVVSVSGRFGRSDEALAQRVPSAPVAGAAGDLVVLPTAIGEKGQLLTVLDPRQKVLSVYHVEFPSGKIKLLSVRNLSWDLQMTYLNNDNPLPQEIRALLEPR
jgi:hypothetical protein